MNHQITQSASGSAYAATSWALASSSANNINSVLCCFVGRGLRQRRSPNRVRIGPGDIAAGISLRNSQFLGLYVRRSPRGANRWPIDDLVLNGHSAVNTEAHEYATVLENNNGDMALIAFMRKRAAQ